MFRAQPTEVLVLRLQAFKRRLKADRARHQRPRNPLTSSAISTSFHHNGGYRDFAVLRFSAIILTTRHALALPYNSCS
jgi:hypothetical protein